MMKKILTSFLCTASLIVSACDVNVFLPKLGETKEVVSSSGNRYEFSLKISQNSACDGKAEQVLYEIKEEGQFSFFVDRSLRNRFLSANEKNEILALLKELDPAKFTSKEEVKKDSEKCLTGENYSLKINGKRVNFLLSDTNPSLKEEYREAMIKLRRLLERIQKNEPEMPTVYSLPLKVSVDGECDLGNQVLYEISPDGNFAIVSEDKASKPIVKKLSRTQLNILLGLLKDLNLNQLAKKDQRIPADAPQTDECRSVKSFILDVNGKQQSFSLNDRKSTHSDEYKKALKKIEELLELLKNDKPLKEFAEYANSPNKPTEQPESSNKKAFDLKYSYGIPIKISLLNECARMAFPSRYLNEISATGVLSYFGPDDRIVEKKLTDFELRDLQNLMFDLNIALLAEKDQPVPPGTPQTEECRNIKEVTMQVNGEERVFLLNDRMTIHSDAYKQALEKLEAKLISLREQSSGTDNSYGFPLKLTNINECADRLPPEDQFLFEVQPEGIFNFYESETGIKKSRKLADAERAELKDLIHQLDFARLAEKDQKVDPGLPQTTECRNIKKFFLNVNDQARTFDFNGRSYIHTTEYLNALKSLEEHLIKLSLTKEEHNYSLPFGVMLNGECGMGLKSIYKVSEEGMFSYQEDDSFLTLEPTTVSSRQLEDFEIKDFKQMLQELDPVKLALDDRPVPPDAIQTKECRMVKAFIMTVDQNQRVFPLNDRKLIHSSEYIEALKQIENKLVTLKRKNSDLVLASFGKTFKLTSGQNALFEEEKLNVKFLKVVEDSRCPEGAQCIWAGRLIIRIDLSRGGQPIGEFDLELGKDLIVKEYTIALQNFDAGNNAFINILKNIK